MRETAEAHATLVEVGRIGKDSLSVALSTIRIDEDILNLTLSEKRRDRVGMVNIATLRASTRKLRPSRSRATMNDLLIWARLGRGRTSLDDNVLTTSSINISLVLIILLVLLLGLFILVVAWLRLRFSASAANALLLRLGWRLGVLVVRIGRYVIEGLRRRLLLDLGLWLGSLALCGTWSSGGRTWTSSARLALSGGRSGCSCCDLDAATRRWGGSIYTTEICDFALNGCLPYALLWVVAVSTIVELVKQSRGVHMPVWPFCRSLVKSCQLQQRLPS